MLSSKKHDIDVKERILHDAISTAIRQRKVIKAQNIIIIVLTVCMGIVLARKAV